MFAESTAGPREDRPYQPPTAPTSRPAASAAARRQRAEAVAAASRSTRTGAAERCETGAGAAGRCEGVGACLPAEQRAASAGRGLDPAGFGADPGEIGRAHV